MLSDIGIPYHVQSRLAVLADGVFRAEIVCQHYIACARQLGHVRWRPASAVWCQARTRLLARAARLSARAQLRGSVATTMHVPLIILIIWAHSHQASALGQIPAVLFTASSNDHSWNLRWH